MFTVRVGCSFSSRADVSGRSQTGLEFVCCEQPWSEFPRTQREGGNTFVGMALAARLVECLATAADAIGTPILFFFECGGACVVEIFRNTQRRRRPPFVLIVLVLCTAALWMMLRSAVERLETAPVIAEVGVGIAVESGSTPPKAGVAASQALVASSTRTAMADSNGGSGLAVSTTASSSTQRIAVTVRSLHTGKYWQVVGGDRHSQHPARLVASASPSDRGHESTVFLLEQEGAAESGGWVLLRWLKTRQLVEVVPPGVPGREDDAWGVRLSPADKAVNELHKLLVEDDASHSQSHVWAVGLRGYLNHLDASGEVVGHGDGMPPAAAKEPPGRGGVNVERLQSGAAWLMEALEERDRQIDALQQQINALRAEVSTLVAQAPTPGRPVGSREALPQLPKPGDVHDASSTSATFSTAEGAALSATNARAGQDSTGSLAELRVATQRHPRVHVDCPATNTRPKKGRGRRGGGAEEADEDEEDDSEPLDEAVARASEKKARKGRADSAGSPATGCKCKDGAPTPTWSYMEGTEYAKFVRGVASRLRLGSGDALLDLAAGDCASSSGMIQQLYRGSLDIMSIVPSAVSARRHSTQIAHLRATHHQPSLALPVNACVSALGHLEWIPDRAFDGAVTFGALSRMRSREKLRSIFRSVLRALHPGGRFIIADAEHSEQCPSDGSGGRGSHDHRRAESAVAAEDEPQSQTCHSCHWRTAAPLAFWSACVPMNMAVSLTPIEHTDLPGTAASACASRHFALIAQRSARQQELSLTVEAGSDGGKTAVLLSLAGHSSNGEWLRRVQHLKEASIDNKRMYCGLHGYSLVIGEDLQHWRDVGWDKVKLLANQLANYDWLLWVSVDSIFADSASALSAITDGERAHLIVLQDAEGDGMGTGALAEPILIRGKSEWSRKLLEDWWGYYADGFEGDARDAFQQVLLGMHEEERARRVRILELDPIFSYVASQEPIPWQAPHRPKTLLVSFDAGQTAPSRAGGHGAAGGAGVSLSASLDTDVISHDSSVCPLRSSDRQMLTCLHAYTSHHLKSIQSADSRYAPPLVYDVTASVSQQTDGGHDEGAASDVAGGWLTPRLSNGASDRRGQGGEGARGARPTCPKYGQYLGSTSKRRSALVSQLTSAMRDAPQPKDGDESSADAGNALCAAGSTWARMPRTALVKHVLAFGERLGIGEGMAVLDVGATCGHALAILQERHRNQLRAVGVDGSRTSVTYAQRTCKGSFCVGDVRQLTGVADDSFDIAYTMDALAQLTSERDVCSVAREMGRVIRPGGRAMLVSVPKADCAVTRDEEWGCPRCYWQLRGIEKGFWSKCLLSGGAGGAADGAYRIEFLSNTQLFPFKPAAYCQREHYTVVIHKKQPATVYVYQQSSAKLAVLTVASTPPIGEYGKQKVHYLTELSIENKRQHATQRGFDFVVAQNLAHGRTARWDKVMLLRRMLNQYQWVHWVDLDTLFMNMKRDPMAFLDPQYDLHVAKDANGLNTGSFYVKASPWSHNFLRRVWEHNDGGKGESDQRSFAHVIAQLSDAERAQHVKYYSQKLFNEYPDPIVSFKHWRGHFREGDYLLHFPGTFCGLSPSGVYTDQHLLSCLHRFTIHFVAAM